MALAKEHKPSEGFYEGEFGVSSFHASPNSSMEMYGVDHDQKKAASNEFKKSNKSNSSSVSTSPSSTNSSNNGSGYHQVSKSNAYLSEECHSLISFNGDFVCANGSSLLSFEQNRSTNDDYSIWEENMHTNNANHHHNMLEASNSIHSVTGYGSPTSGVPFGWLNTEASAAEETFLVKRPSTGESSQAFKKQCTTTTVASSVASKKPKPKSTTPLKDPQSIAAKNRRERISERLKILQDLVPNGSKVDLVTMLEKAISYVKFLQLQVKVLATDEFWPAQGGKAPDLSQVKEAIDVILASQRDRNSS